MSRLRLRLRLRRIEIAFAIGCGSHTAAPQPDVPPCDGQTIPLIATPGRLHVAVDTGSSTTFLQEPLGSSSDAEGNVVKLYEGTALTIGAWQGTVPVLRAPSFPYLEQTVAALGGRDTLSISQP